MKNLVRRIVAMLVACLLSVVDYAQTSIGGTGTTGKTLVTAQMFSYALCTSATDNSILSNEKQRRRSLFPCDSKGTYPC